MEREKTGTETQAFFDISLRKWVVYLRERIAEDTKEAAEEKADKRLALYHAALRLDKEKFPETVILESN